MDASLVLALGPDRGADLAALVTEPPGTPLAVAADPRLLEETRRTSPRIASALPTLDVEWVRTGWGADLSLLPLRTVRALLEREDAILEALGMSAPALWLRGADPCVLEALPPGVTLLLLEGVERPGVVVRHATVLPVLPVGPVVRVVSEIPRHSAGPTPSRRIADDPPVGALPWPTPPPGPESLARRLARAASLARSDPDVLAALATAAGPGAGEAEAVRARAAVDRRAHRREEWTTFSEPDWDADGLADIEIESPRLSLVVDPAESLGILTLDDMAAEEPLARPGGRLCATVPVPLSFVVGRTSRSRASVTVPFVADRIACRLTVDRWTLTLTYGVSEGGSLRLGPDLRFLGVPAVRVDGSSWWRPAESLTGHRLRLDFGRRHVLVSSRLPSTFDFAVDDEGIGLVVHRQVAPGSSYEVAIDVSAPSRTDRSEA